MAIKIDRDRNSHGDRFRVTTHDAGFGRGASQRGVTLDQAFELVRHYYMDSTHVKDGCPWCADKPKSRARTSNQ